MNTFIDGMLSAAAGASILVISLIKKGQGLDFLLYTGDAIFTVVVCLLCIKQPIKLIKDSFIELAGGTLQNKKTASEIMATIDSVLPADVSYTKCNIVKTGSYYKVYLYPKFYDDILKPSQLANIKNTIVTSLKTKISFIDVHIIIA